MISKKIIMNNWIYSEAPSEREWTAEAMETIHLKRWLLDWRVMRGIMLKGSVNMCHSLHFIKLLIVMKGDERSIMLIHKTSTTTSIFIKGVQGWGLGQERWTGRG